MPVQVNTLGIGALASVSWTPLQGAGLSIDEEAVVDQNAKAASQVADTLLAAIKSAINEGRSGFSLEDLEAAGRLPVLANGARSAADWAAFISRSLRTDQSASEADWFNPWRRIAADMQCYAAQLISSRDPAPSSSMQWGSTAAEYDSLHLYQPGDVVKVQDSAGGFEAYYATKTDASIMEALGDARNKVAIPGNDKQWLFPSYDPNKSYQTGDYVYWNGTGPAPGGGSTAGVYYWTYEAVGDSADYYWSKAPTYDPDTKYYNRRSGSPSHAGDIVEYKGSYYEVTDFNITDGIDRVQGRDPTDTRYWTLVGRPAMQIGRNPKDNPDYWNHVQSGHPGVPSKSDLRGGVSHANGQWYANGQALSLLDLFTALRVNQLVNYDDSIEGNVNLMTQNQTLLNAARAWGSFLRAKKPSNIQQDGKSPTAALTWDDVITFKLEYPSIDPIGTFTPKAKDNLGTSEPSTVWDTWLTQLKSYIDLKDTDNQTLKGQIDQKYNRRSEVIDAMVSFARKESKTGSNMASSLG